MQYTQCRVVGTCEKVFYPVTFWLLIPLHNVHRCVHYKVILVISEHSLSCQFSEPGLDGGFYGIKHIKKHFVKILFLFIRVGFLEVFVLDTVEVKLTAFQAHRFVCFLKVAVIYVSVSYVF